MSDGAASFLARLGAARRRRRAPPDFVARWAFLTNRPETARRFGFAAFRIRELADAARRRSARADASTPRSRRSIVRGRTVFARVRPGHAAHTDGRESLESRDPGRDARGRGASAAAWEGFRHSKTARDGDFGKSGGGRTHHDGGVSGEGIAGVDEGRVVAGGAVSGVLFGPPPAFGSRRRRRLAGRRRRPINSGGEESCSRRRRKRRARESKRTRRL